MKEIEMICLLFFLIGICLGMRLFITASLTKSSKLLHNLAT